MTPESVAEYVGRVLQAVARGELVPRTADTLTKGATSLLTALRQHHEQGKIRELRALVERAEELDRRGRERQAADRAHQVAKKGQA